MITKEQMIKEFEKTLAKNNNQWQRGVIEYAKEFLDTLEENYNIKDFATEFSNEQLMNNASSPKQHSNSGNTLISNYDIAIDYIHLQLQKLCLTRIYLKFKPKQFIKL